jgi:tRNA pseudouridine38-40 synthase
VGAGRTDAGVHALGQVVSTTCWGSIPTSRIVEAANSVLPDDMALVSAEDAQEGFDARRDAVGKTYIYVFDMSPARSPFRQRYSLHVGKRLDVAAMEEASRHFVGTHDFSAFRASGSSVKTSVRTVREARVHDMPCFQGCVAFEITADGFLYNMVRIMAGLLLDVGSARVGAREAPAIIESRDRSRAGATLPACGLWLKSVQYWPRPAAGGSMPDETSKTLLERPFLTGVGGSYYNSFR